MNTGRESRGGGEHRSSSADETPFAARAPSCHGNQVVLSITPLLEMLAESIVAFDLDGSCLYANPASEQLLGARSESLVGASSPPRWIHPQHAALWAILFEWGRSPHTLASEVLSTDLELVPTSSRSVRARVTWDPVLGPDGSAACLLGMIRTSQDDAVIQVDLRTDVDLRGMLDDLRTLLDRLGELDPETPRRVAPCVGPAGPPGTNDVLADEWRQRLGCLSERENEVLSHLLEGKRIATTAQLMYLSEHTVRNHLKAVYRKLGLHSVAELRELLTPAGRVGLVSLDPAVGSVRGEREPEPLAW